MPRALLIILVAVAFILVVVPGAVINAPFQRTPGKVEEAGRLIRVKFVTTGEVRSIKLEDYLVGVLAAEMPAEYGMEALKAQAIAARTYAAKRMATKGKLVNDPLPDADVSTDFKAFQGWLSNQEMKEKWGMVGYVRYRLKLEEAVAATKDWVLTYQGDLIDPVFHASCGGNRTENSEDVWKFKVPYLRSVACYERTGESRAQETLTLAKAGNMLGVDLQSVPAANLFSSLRVPLRVLERTATGRIKKIRVGERIFSGVEFREKLGLRSTNLSWQYKSGKIIFTSTGYGHGVGLCQTGANAMAKMGKKYDEILRHYYRGVKIERLR